MAAVGDIKVASVARTWNPDFKHTDRERWICIYTAYISSRKTIAEGRRVPKNKAVDNPTPQEIRDVLSQAGLDIGVENKVYPREVDKYDKNARGRIRVRLRNEDGSPALPQFESRNSILDYLCDTIPKLKTRSQSSASSQQQSGASSATGAAGKKKGGKKK